MYWTAIPPKVLAQVVADHLGPIAHHDDQALDAVSVEGADESLEDRHAAHRDQAFRHRVGQRREATASAGGEQ